HRRAAQQKQQQQPVKPVPTSNSLIGRALARFQSANSGDFKKAEPAPEARVLPGDKPARSEWKAEAPPVSEPVPAPVLVSGIALDGPEAQIAASAEAEAPKESFLTRN